MSLVIGKKLNNVIALLRARVSLPNCPCLYSCVASRMGSRPCSFLHNPLHHFLKVLALRPFFKHRAIRGHVKKQKQIASVLSVVSI